MPCFKGLAVSIHTPNGPLPEYSVQRQSRVSRIASYIPVPPPKIPDSSTSKPEQSTFAISITLLIPGQSVPYSTPKPTPENPHPKAKVVGLGRNSNTIGPYQPLTSSPNETVAAYIYFDGRQKEEVATLLRRGEETWVNSRWVGVPESEGGGLAEREFLFREVGLERWLNGLDLEGKDAAAKIERRRQKMERRRRKRGLISQHQDGDHEMETDDKKEKSGQGVLRYGADAQSPLENISDDGGFSSESDMEDDDPIPETAGQIKVALFRVLASGEIKRGEYSPQFDAHDDDEDNQGTGGQGANGQGSNDADVDHTTSFAKPKSLDPKSISTQTVTGIDPPDRPYATFTFMYRGERQLQKMGILNPSKTQDKDATTARRTSLQPDFANLAPLKPGGAVGFVKFRDNNEEGVGKSRKKAKTGSGSDMDSDDDEPSSIITKVENEEDKDINPLLSPDDARQQGELAEGLRQIKLKRQHSAEPLSSMGVNTPKSNTPASISTPPATGKPATTPPHSNAEASDPSLNNLLETDSAFIGSPMKKQRASVTGADDEVFKKRMGSGLSTNIQEVLGTAGAGAAGAAPGSNVNANVNVIKELDLKQEPEEDL
ncbi:hypothetical protein FQN52_009021 [Onygenales sp. PD_12]|nr:hypothetical protein FQN53_005712 [Emmonsiellopsis sp. PD_33]KAK2784440.1 hypothetical protein FQN52_009021 [Onygenales sp. PD_12]